MANGIYTPVATQRCMHSPQFNQVGRKNHLSWPRLYSFVFLAIAILFSSYLEIESDFGNDRCCIFLKLSVLSIGALHLQSAFFSTPSLCLRGKLSHHFSLIHFRGIILKLFLCQNLTFVTIPSLFWHQIDRQEMIFYFYFRWGEGCVIYHFSFENYNNHAGLSLIGFPP